VSTNTIEVSTSEPELTRFDRVERIVHWTTAALFLTCMATSAALYAGPVSTIVGRRDLVRMIHVVAGLALPIPLLIGVIGRWGRHLRRDLSTLNRWSADDRAWWRRARRAKARLGKFNPGQKLNATFLGAAIVVMLGTGVILKWFSIAPLDWRVGATFVHDWFALAIWISVLAHIFLALRDPVALGGMRRGTVTARWARSRRPRWYEEQTGQPAAAESPPGP
jgi:formate dehydrogenase subunit gamma